MNAKAAVSTEYQHERRGCLLAAPRPHHQGNREQSEQGAAGIAGNDTQQSEPHGPEQRQAHHAVRRAQPQIVHQRQADQQPDRQIVVVADHAGGRPKHAVLAAGMEGERAALDAVVGERDHHHPDQRVDALGVGEQGADHQQEEKGLEHDRVFVIDVGCRRHREIGRDRDRDQEDQQQDGAGVPRHPLGFAGHDAAHGGREPDHQRPGQVGGDAEGKLVRAHEGDETPQQHADERPRRRHGQQRQHLGAE